MVLSSDNLKITGLVFHVHNFPIILSSMIHTVYISIYSNLWASNANHTILLSYHVTYICTFFKLSLFVYMLVEITVFWLKFIQHMCTMLWQTRMTCSSVTVLSSYLLRDWLNIMLSVISEMDRIMLSVW